MKGGEPMIPEIKKILYATDLSKNSSYAFLYAVDMAKRHDAKLVILHVVEAVPLYAYSELGFLGDKVLKKTLERDRAEDINLIKNYLPEFCTKVESQIGPPCVELVSKILVPIGHPADEILKVADEGGMRCRCPWNPWKGIFGPYFSWECFQCGVASDSKTGFYHPIAI